VKFWAQHFEPADVIAVLMSEKDTVEVFRRDPAQGEAIDELTRAESAVDQEPAMIGHDERAISGAPTSEHGQTKHAAVLTNARDVHKWKARKITIAERASDNLFGKGAVKLALSRSRGSIAEHEILAARPPRCHCVAPTRRRPGRRSQSQESGRVTP
jgi:hypothetical protein